MNAWDVDDKWCLDSFSNLHTSQTDWVSEKSLLRAK